MSSRKGVGGRGDGGDGEDGCEDVCKSCAVDVEEEDDQNTNNALSRS